MARTMESALLDDSTLGALYEDFASTGDLAEFGELIGSFLDRCADQVERVATAVAVGDPAAIHDTAHKLKGSARTLGAGRLGTVAAALEAAANALEIATARALMADLRDAFLASHAALEAYRARFA
jgi:HPt (histidine-containing phosphotransfer) domain-containing protein